MTSKYLTVFVALVSLMLFSRCGEEDNLVLVGFWLAEEVTRKDCDNPILDGPVNCINDVGSGNSTSCVRLTLEENNRYLLEVTFDSDVTNEIGDYSSSEGNLRLCPTSPANECYNLPISNADFDTMIIELPRDGGCIAVINMIKV